MERVIPVHPRKAPPDFAKKVAQPGTAWLAAKGYDPAAPLPRKANPPPYWRVCLPELHAAYRGVCAYLAVYVEPAAGGISVDHFVAKSSLAGGTYDWDNYRLACTTMNARKGAFDDVLDPFTLPNDPELFHLELVSGRLFVNPALPQTLAMQAEATRNRLNLDSGGNRAMRAKHFGDYVAGDVSRSVLLRDSPFVYSEACRQGLL